MIAEENVVWVDDLGVDSCWKLLERRLIGRVGFTSGDEQVILPVNYVVDGRSIVIRTGRTGMLDVLGPGTTVAFEVDETDGFSETGWSVLVKGYASEVKDPTGRSTVEESSRSIRGPVGLATTGSGSSRGR